MKKITILLSILLISWNSSAQIYGNKKIATETFSLAEIQTLEINLSAKVIIDMEGKPEITITTDSNLIPHINRTIKNGRLDLTQLKWIEPSQETIVNIGAPALRKLITDAHGDYFVQNINGKQFNAICNIGKLQLDGKVEALNLIAKSANVDASKLIAQNADITITGWGEVSANVENKLSSSVKEKSALKLVKEPKELVGDAPEKAKKRTDKSIFKNARFIDLKIKNNSFNRRQFVVVGPKKSGSFFSYGFPLWPGQIKKERWSIGTKVYKKSRWGLRKLLVTITAEDEGKIVDLFDSK